MRVHEEILGTHDQKHEVTTKAEIFDFFHKQFWAKLENYQKIFKHVFSQING
jgi:hypothetical protein